MTKYILIAGLAFYGLTFVTIFWVTFLQMESSRPGAAYVINYHTQEKVWQPDFKAFDLYSKTRHQAIIEPSHNQIAHSAHEEAKKNNPEAATSFELEVAYGQYWDRLFSDADYAGSAPSVTQGNEAYTEAVCWHCHSQFVRPLTYENYRWGPTSQIGEGAHENPSRYGTRRIGPDLSREGNFRSDDWHYAHFNDPRYTVPQSVMAPYGGISRYWHQVKQARRNTIQEEVYQEMESLNTEHKGLSDMGRAAKGFQALDRMMADYAAADEEVWLLWKGTQGANVGGKPIVRVAKKPQSRVRDLVAYVQTRGIGIGITKKTDDLFQKLPKESGEKDSSWQKYIRKLEFSAGRWRLQGGSPRPLSRPEYVLAPAELKAAAPAQGADFAETDRFNALQDRYDYSVNRGAKLFMKKCSGCHGGLDESGDAFDFDLAQKESLKLIGNGYGPAAAWLVPEPRNFHLAAWPQNQAAEKGKQAQVLMPFERGSEVGAYKNRSGDLEIPLARPSDLHHTIRNGMAPSSMPAWPFLTDWEIWDLVNFIMFLGDGEALIQKYISFGMNPEQASAKVPSYYNIDAVQKAFSLSNKLPELIAKPNLDSAGIGELLSSAANGKELSGKTKENYAAAYWAKKFPNQIVLDGTPWKTHELVLIGQKIFSMQEAAVSTGDPTPDCKSCHGPDGDSWGARRGEMLNAHGFAARNYYSGQFKLGASRDGIYRAMRYGIANTLMNAQINDTWTALESIALAEFVLDKRNQGVFGIEDN